MLVFLIKLKSLNYFLSKRGIFCLKLMFTHNTHTQLEILGNFFLLLLLLSLSYLPTPPLGQDMTQGQFLSGF